MAKLGSNEFMLKMFLTRLDMIKSGDKIDMLKKLLPQRIEDSSFLNFDGQVILGAGKLHDVVFHEDNIFEGVNRLTNKFFETFFTPIDAFLNGDVAEEDEPVEDEIEDATVDEPAIDLLGDIEALLEKDKVKKAKKFLKEFEDHDDYKKAKKLIKKAGK